MDSPPADRQYGWLLRCYPASFRARFEPGMRDAFRQDHAAARARGRRALAAFWLVTIAQGIVFGLAERRPSRSSSMTFLTHSDWRDAWRSLRATPVITAVAVLSLALGTGANTALFSILNSMLYKPLPVHDPGQLVLLDKGVWTNPIWEQIRDRAPQFSDGALAWCASRFDLSEQGETEFVPGAYVSGSTFDVLGLKPELGRLLTPADDTRGNGAEGPVAVIGYDFWQRRFGGAPDIVGRAISVQRIRFTIVGVMPRDFFGLDVGSNLAIAIPIAANEAIRGGRTQLDGRSTWWLEIMARLRPDQTRENAAAALNTSRADIRAATLPTRWRPEDLAAYLNDPWTFVPARTGVSDLRSTYRSPLVVILVIVGLVLVIACANIANVLIARSASRRHELSVRLALGATRWRLARQLLLESAMMAAAGAILGLAFAEWSGGLLIRQISTATFLDLAFDWRVLAFTAGVAAATAILFGVAPALGMVGVAPNDALKLRGRGAAPDARFGIRHALVVAQVALSLALVVAAGLFVHTFASLTSRRLGFDVDPILVINVNAQKSTTPTAARPALYERVREAAASVPGVAAAGLSYTTPLGNASWNTIILLPDQPNLPERERAPMVNSVTPGWFALYGTALVAGRDFESGDRAGAPDVAIVNRTFADKFLAGVNPIGRQITEQDGRNIRVYQVVGLVEDAAYQTVREKLLPTLYVPVAQVTDEGLFSGMALSVRTRSGSPSDLTRPVSAAIASVDPNLALTPRPLSTSARNAVRQERLIAMLSGFFGGLALLLAGLGLYGVTSYSVSRRRGEIGIRIALGALPSAVVRLVLARSGWLIAIGIAVGAVVSLWSVRYVGTLLYGVAPHDPVTIAGAVMALAGIGLIAAWLPARRAARVDPTTTLRES